jgi:hypothetical protein
MTQVVTLLQDFFGVEEDNEASMYFTNPTTVFRPDKDVSTMFLCLLLYLI